MNLCFLNVRSLLACFFAASLCLYAMRNSLAVETIRHTTAVLVLRIRPKFDVYRRINYEVFLFFSFCFYDDSARSYLYRSACLLILRRALVAHPCFVTLVCWQAVLSCSWLDLNYIINDVPTNNSRLRHLRMILFMKTFVFPLNVEGYPPKWLNFHGLANAVFTHLIR